MTTITGDTIHTCFEFWRCCPVYSNDTSVAILDYQDMQGRLSAALPAAGDWPPPEMLPEEADSLLKVGVTCSTVQFKEAQAADESVLCLLRAFLEQPIVNKSATWKSLFGARPVRGTLARLARHCGAELHSTMQFVNYKSQSA